MKPVCKFDLNGNFIEEYSSASEAARILNLNQRSISKACNGKLKTYSGFIWKFR